jgi:hypothetical protein
MIDYIFNLNPGKLNLQNQAIIISVLLLAIAVAGFFLLKKRREFIKLNKDQRLTLHKAFKFNMFVSAGLVLFMLFRVGQISFLSMRFFPIAISLSIAVLYGIGIVKAIMYRDRDNTKTIVVDEYAKFLPHKKKK